MDEFLTQRMGKSGARPGPVGGLPSSRALVPASKGMFESFSWWWIAVGAAVLLGGYLLYNKMTQKGQKGPYQGVAQPRPQAPGRPAASPIANDMAYAYQQARMQAAEDARDTRPKGGGGEPSYIPDPPAASAPMMAGAGAVAGSGGPPHPMVRPPNDVDKHGMPMLARANPFNPKTNAYVA